MQYDEQLPLFGRRKRRPGRGSREFNLHVMVADVLERWATPGWQWTHLPFGEHRNAITGARLKRMGTKRGWPDFILLPPLKIVPNMLAPERKIPLYPRPCFLELKRKGGKLTEEQSELMLWMIANCYEYEVCDNFNDAINVLRDWGAVRASVRA